MNPVELKQKIKTVKNIHHVVHSMETLATMKIIQVRKKADLRKAYLHELENILFSFLSIVPQKITKNVLLAPTKVKNPLIVAVTSDRGFCGTMNQQLIATTRHYLRDNNRASVISIGKKAGNVFLKEDFPVLAMISQSLEKVDLHFSQSLASDIVRGFLNNEYDAVYFCYMQFTNLVSQKPIIKQILPIVKNSDEAFDLRYNYESVYLLPSPKEVFSKLVRKYLDALVYSVLLEAAASEQAMRMISMKNATENADEMIQSMQKKYQKIRQERITLELIELHNEQKGFDEE
jgi:F-type H+-transporting ATPase subunit gamma